MRREAWDCARSGSNGAMALRWDGGRIARLGAWVLAPLVASDGYKG